MPRLLQALAQFYGPARQQNPAGPEANWGGLELEAWKFDSDFSRRNVLLNMAVLCVPVTTLARKDMPRQMAFYEGHTSRYEAVERTRWTENTEFITGVAILLPTVFMFAPSVAIMWEIIVCRVCKGGSYFHA